MICEDSADLDVDQDESAGGDVPRLEGIILVERAVGSEGGLNNAL